MKLNHGFFSFSNSAIPNRNKCILGKQGFRTEWHDIQALRYIVKLPKSIIIILKVFPCY